jgi:hypothetical protein
VKPCRPEEVLNIVKADRSADSRVWVLLRNEADSSLQHAVVYICEARVRSLFPQSELMTVQVFSPNILQQREELQMRVNCKLKFFLTKTKLKRHSSRKDSISGVSAVFNKALPRSNF